MRAPLGRPFAGLTVLLLVLAGCSDGQDEDESAAEAAADDLAAALTAGDFLEVDIRGETRKAVSADYAEAVEGMTGRRPGVTVEGVEVAEDGDSATVTLAWSWPIADGQAWSYETEAALTGAGSAWALNWERAVVEPSLTATSVLDASTVAGGRGDITGAGGKPIVTERPVVEVGVDRSQASKAEAVAAAARVAAATEIAVAPYVKQVRAAGEQAFVRAITYRAADVPAEVRALPAPGALLLDGQLPLAPTREFAAPIIGSVGDVTAEMIKEEPDLYQVGDQAGLSGLQARYDEGCAARRRRSSTRWTRRRRPSASCSGSDSADGTPLALTLDVRPADRGRAAACRGRPGQRPRGDPAQQRRDPGRGERPRQRWSEPRDLRAVRAGLDVQGRQQPGPAACRPHAGHHRLVHRRPPWSTASGSRTTPTTRPRRSARSRSGRRWPTPATPPSSPSATSWTTPTCSTPPPRSAWASTTTSASRRTSAASSPPSSETEGAANMIGQGRILASPMAMATVIGSVQRGKIVVPRLVEPVEVDAPDGAAPLTASRGRRAARRCCAGWSPRAAAGGWPTCPARR